SNILGFKNKDDFENFAKRYLKYLQNQALTKNRVMSGFFILLEIQKETLAKNKTLINLENIKNQHIKKYSTLILDLRKNGMGSQSIVKYLYENHRIKVSRGTIEKFYKQNNL
ncbi:hypothetical protein, partial [Aliarcobacter butzleri]|uniref:hypothetical protein n=1 Tax=Aliarcobacter butzleri TaxID=28197 RepID=UPI001869F0DD